MTPNIRSNENTPPVAPATNETTVAELLELAKFARVSLHTNGDNEDVDGQVAKIAAGLAELAAIKAQQHEAVAWQLRYPAYLERPATEWVPITQKQFDRIDGLTGTFEVRALYANPKAQQPSGVQAGLVGSVSDYAARMAIVRFMVDVNAGSELADCAKSLIGHLKKLAADASPLPVAIEPSDPDVRQGRYAQYDNKGNRYD